MTLETGVLFGEYHSYNDWALVLVSRPDTGTPAPRTYKQEVPGADGDLDLTEATTGEVKYSNRQMTFVFRRMIDAEEQEALKSEIYGALHGRRMKIVLDEDSEYYYTGRLTVKEFKRTHCKVDITITADAEPYKQAHDETIVDVEALQSESWYEQPVSAEDVSKLSWNTDFSLLSSGYYLFDFTKYNTIDVHFPENPRVLGTKTVYVTGKNASNADVTYSRDIIKEEMDSGEFIMPVAELTGAGIDLSKISRILVSGVGGCSLTASIYNISQITVENGKKRVVPEIYCSVAGVEMIHNGRTYVLAEGWQQFPDLLLNSGWNYFLFINNQGAATAQIKFRRGWL